jgi:hypothetical protein
MNFKNFTFLKHKAYLLSGIALAFVGIVASQPAYSQIDYFYGTNKKGIRLDVGVGVGVLNANWGTNPPGAAGKIGLDYDLSPYFSVGLEGATGMLTGKDSGNKYYFTKDAVTYVSGSFGFKVAIGILSSNPSKSVFQEAMKRIYVGAGIGEVFANASLTPHSDGKGLAALEVADLAYGKTGKNVKYKSNGKTEGGDAYPFIPINIGTNIALRGLFGNDKIELNPNFQYNYVLSPLFDGYQPNSKALYSPTRIGESGNQSYFIGSLAIRVKF